MSAPAISLPRMKSLVSPRLSTAAAVARWFGDRAAAAKVRRRLPRPEPGSHSGRSYDRGVFLVLRIRTSTILSAVLSKRSKVPT